ncbi:MAG: photosystem II assembly protein, partial [Synechococcaceae bacterium WB8_1B_136]|nr:photosystem II assembly protein [Synechococcaceae bacterium WB8_1B_136]
MQRLVSTLSALVLSVVLALGLGGCVTTGLPTATASPWQPVDIHTKSNPLALAFTDGQHGFLVGSNRLILETNDGGASWQERALDLPAEENFRLISVDFNGDEGWIAGQPGLLLHSTDGGQNWSRLFLDTKL